MYCTYSSTACLDVAWFGIPIVICAPNNGLNLNPLISFVDAAFVDRPDELYQQLKNPQIIQMNQDFLCFDKQSRNFSKVINSVSFSNPRLEPQIF